MRPHVAVLVDAPDHDDLRQQGVARDLHPPLVGDEDVEAALLHLDVIEPVLERRELGLIQHEQRAPAAQGQHPRRHRRDQVRILDRRQQRAKVGERELEARTRGLPLFLAGKQVDFDHAARLSANPTDSISSGATSSIDTAWNAASR